MFAKEIIKKLEGQDVKRIVFEDPSYLHVDQVSNELLDMLVQLASVTNTLRDIDIKEIKEHPIELDKQVMRDLFACAPDLKKLALSKLDKMDAGSRQALIRSFSEFLSSKVDSNGNVKLFDNDDPELDLEQVNFSQLYGDAELTEIDRGLVKNICASGQHNLKQIFFFSNPKWWADQELSGKLFDFISKQQRLESLDLKASDLTSEQLKRLLEILTGESFVNSLHSLYLKGSKDAWTQENCEALLDLATASAKLSCIEADAINVDQELDKEAETLRVVITGQEPSQVSCERVFTGKTYKLFINPKTHIR